MSQKVKVKRSSVPSKVPTTLDVDLGEIAINTYDGRMFIKKDTGVESIVEIGGATGGIPDHNTLTGRDAANAHPSSSIDYSAGLVGPVSGFTAEGGFYTQYIAGEDLQQGETAYFQYNAGADGAVVKTPVDGMRIAGVVYANALSGNPVKVVWGGKTLVKPEDTLTPIKGAIIVTSSNAAGRANQTNTDIQLYYTPNGGNGKELQRFGYWIAAGTGAGALTMAHIQI
jgi:hypothetical protein